MQYDEYDNGLKVYRVIEHKLGEERLVGLYLREKDAYRCCSDCRAKYGLSYFCVEEYILEFYYEDGSI